MSKHGGFGKDKLFLHIVGSLFEVRIVLFHFRKISTLRNVTHKAPPLTFESFHFEQEFAN